MIDVEIISGGVNVKFGENVNSRLLEHVSIIIVYFFINISKIYIIVVHENCPWWKYYLGFGKYPKYVLWFIFIGNFPPLDIGFWLIKFTKSHTSYIINKTCFFLNYFPNIDISYSCCFHSLLYICTLM